MRYQRFDARTDTPKAPVAAVWPSFEEVLLHRPGAEGKPAEADEAAPVASPAAAAPDVPAAVGGLIVGAYAALIAVFFTLFASSPLAFFAISVCAGFVAIFFAVPRLFFAVEADPARRPTLSHFMHHGIQTLTGRTSGKDALIQMLIVPALLTFGLMTMGIVAKIYIG